MNVYNWIIFCSFMLDFPVLFLFGSIQFPGTKIYREGIKKKNIYTSLHMFEN